MRVCVRYDRRVELIVRCGAHLLLSQSVSSGEKGFALGLIRPSARQDPRSLERGGGEGDIK
eukprot:6207871-Pleurochrysis_carterae.AAC.1